MRKQKALTYCINSKIVCLISVAIYVCIKHYNINVSLTIMYFILYQNVFTFGTCIFFDTLFKYCNYIYRNNFVYMKVNKHI